jgi:arginine/lysine/ornithine decarboxylase
MPAFNQAAVLNVGSDSIDLNRLQRAIGMVTTTSPSYPILASMDYSREQLQKDRALTVNYLEALWSLRHELAHCHSLKLVSDSVKGQNAIADIDISKLTIMIRTNTTGYEVAKQLREGYNIEIEYAGLHHIIAMTSIADSPKALKRFGKAIKELDSHYERKFVEKLPTVGTATPVVAMTPRKVFYSDTARVDMQESIGKICAESVCVFPPDIPVVAVGQVITAEHIDTVRALYKAGVSIIGVEDNKLSVVTEA